MSAWARDAWWVPAHGLALAGWFVVAFVFTAGGRALAAGMEPLTRLPLGLLPTFLVPLIITTHVVIGRRARAVGSDVIEQEPENDDAAGDAE